MGLAIRMCLVITSMVYNLDSHYEGEKFFSRFYTYKLQTESQGMTTGSWLGAVENVFAMPRYGRSFYCTPSTTGSTLFFASFGAPISHPRPKLLVLGLNYSSP